MVWTRELELLVIGDQEHGKTARGDITMVGDLYNRRRAIAGSAVAASELKGVERFFRDREDFFLLSTGLLQRYPYHRARDHRRDRTIAAALRPNLVSKPV
ncbi:hypothetical protein HAX54_004962 [Datura stramonium]|uniref:Uncharacterized protein n=1 Tax=Datura stramonium TaxID=4076 RepID=A0ABS8T8M8_DATST|nr:hypothetical protein [Datura stramonium]